MSNISHKKIFVVSSSLWKMLKISFSSKIHHQEVTLADLLTIYYPSSAAQDIFNHFYLQTATKNSLRHGTGCPCTLVLREGNPWISPSKHNFPGVTEPGTPSATRGRYLWSGSAALLLLQEPATHRDTPRMVSSIPATAPAGINRDPLGICLKQQPQGVFPGPGG